MAAPKTLPEEKVQGYEIKARGQYYAKDKSLKMYTLTFFIPKEVEVQVRRVWKWFKSGKSKIRRSVPVYDKVNGRENAQYIIQRLLLPGELAKNYQDALAHKTCQIIETKIASRPASKFSDITTKPIAEMTKQELARFCALHSLATPIDSFSAIEDARQAVQDSFDEATLYSKKASTDPDADLEEVPEDEAPGDPDDEASGPGDGAKVEDGDDDLLN